jgi:hypothetical protein
VPSSAENDVSFLISSLARKQASDHWTRTLAFFKVADLPISALKIRLLPVNRCAVSSRSDRKALAEKTG